MTTEDVTKQDVPEAEVQEVTEKPEEEPKAEPNMEALQQLRDEVDRQIQQLVAEESKRLDSHYKSVAHKDAGKYQREAQMAKREAEIARESAARKEQFFAALAEQGQTLNKMELQRAFAEIDRATHAEKSTPTPNEGAMWTQIAILEQKLTEKGVRYNDPRITRDPNNPDAFIDSAFEILGMTQPSPEAKIEPESEPKVEPKPVPAASPAGGGATMSDAAFLKKFNDPEYVPTAADTKRAKSILSKLS